jgi:hypothetical protein
MYFYCTKFTSPPETLNSHPLLCYSYSFTCFAFQCGVVVILPASGVGCACWFKSSDGEFDWFMQTL